MSAAEIPAALKEQKGSAEELAAELNIIFEDYFTGDIKPEDKTYYTSVFKRTKI